MKTSETATRRPICPRSAALALLLGLSVSQAWASPITGDTVTGDLTVEGDAIRIDNATDQFELRLGTNRIDLWHSAPGEWVWSHGATPTDVMSLDASNILSLYDLGAASSNPSIILNPGDPDASPAVAPSITIGGDEVLTESSALNIGFINSGNFGTEISTYLFGNSLSLSDGAASGYHSTAMSYGFAIGEYSTAMSGAYAYGFGSTAMSSGQASGYGSTAMTYGYALGGNSTAMSDGTADATSATGISGGYADGEYSVALSSGYAGNERATAMSGGYAYGYYSVSLLGQADGDFSISLGGIASGEFSTAMGGGQASGGYSLAAGETVVSSFGAAAFGRYNEDRNGSGIGTTWDGTLQDSVFEIGIGSDSNNRANALTVLQDGSVEVGKDATDGSVPFQVKSDGSVVLAKPQGDISMGAYQ